jgi:spore coat protein U-like protein
MFGSCKRAVLAAGALLAMIGGMGGEAKAQTTVTDTFGVQITIENFCEITNPTVLDFGTNQLLNANIDATTTFDVQCTNNLPYDVGLDLGSNPTGVTRRMIDTTLTPDEYVSYELYTSNTYATVWGDTVGTDTVAATGNGAVQTHTVYGRVPPQTTPSADTYTDTVTIEVTY